MTVAVGTLAGVPPLAGFLTRVLLISSAADTHYGWLAIVAVGCDRADPDRRAAVRRDAVRRRRGRGAIHTRCHAARVAHRRRSCLPAGVALVVLIQPLLAVATAGAGTLR